MTTTCNYNTIKIIHGIINSVPVARQGPHQAATNNA